MPHHTELCIFITDLVLPFQMFLQQKDVTLSLKSVLILFQHRVIPSGCSVLKNKGNHKTRLCWPIQPENWNCSCPLLTVVSAWGSCWPGEIGRLVSEGSNLRMLCVVHSRFDVSAGWFCVMVCGSPVWLTESTCACWAEQDGFFWICKQGLKQNFRSPFPVDLSAYEFRQRGHKTLMCLFELCVEELSVRMVQHHCSHRRMTVLLILWICCLLIFVHELRAMQRNYTHIAVPSGRTISKMKPLKAC